MTDRDWTSNIEILISKEEIQSKVTELAGKISLDYKDLDLFMVGVLRGCFLFMADLCRQIDLPLICDFLGISSYGDDTKSSGVIRITSDLTSSVENKDILVIEDIVDTGLTMNYLVENLFTRRPRSVKICSLLSKPARRKVSTEIGYLGFEVPDTFVVGYGLDYRGRYRNLDYIGKLDHL